MKRIFLCLMMLIFLMGSSAFSQEKIMKSSPQNSRSLPVQLEPIKMSTITSKAPVYQETHLGGSTLPKIPKEIFSVSLKRRKK